MRKEETISYPLMDEWTIPEIINVIKFYQAVDQLYEKKIERNNFLKKYQQFLKIVPQKSLQKQLDRRYLAQSGHSLYRAVKFVQESQDKNLHYVKR
ncbi:UPF0223 family protein [Liquorilactobacillus sicerae]|uniref:UPF0223 family protein n=1 Tax=Liquorilactobacillus sicerae TaxID=1416943 RepID=UPI002480BB40|nr:UPF0223 family protein [Liquorilactobacillus sicerae]